MSTPSDQQDKAHWREWAKARRRELEPSLPALSEATCTHLRAFLKERGVKTLLAYHALPGELDVAALQGDFRLLTTRAHFGPPRYLSLHPWESATQRSRLGLLQPPPDAPRVPLTEADAVLLPALAFDRTGVRLGYGGGFYDRLLAGWTGLSIGVLPAALLVDRLPAEAHDIRAGWLATEEGILRT